MKKFILSLIFHTIFLIGFLIGLIEVILTEGENYIFAVCMGIGYCASYIVLYTLFSRYTNKFPKMK